MQQMLGAQQAALAELGNMVEHGVPLAATHALGVGLTHTQGVEHGSDATGGNFCVVRQQRGRIVPAHSRAGHQVAFEVIRVHLHHAGPQVVAFQIDSAGQAARAGVDAADVRAIEVYAAINDFIG